MFIHVKVTKGWHSTIQFPTLKNDIGICSGGQARFKVKFWFDEHISRATIVLSTRLFAGFIIPQHHNAFEGENTYPILYAGVYAGELVISGSTLSPVAAGDRTCHHQEYLRFS